MTEKWRYETGFGSVRLIDSDEIVALPYGQFDTPEIKDRRGRLIAAAPEMYSWLKTIAGIFDEENIINVSGIKELLARIDGEDEWPRN